MLNALLVILGAQLAGEALAQALHLPLPGPVIGLILLTAGFALIPGLVALVRPVAQGILGHLSLLFVPAGVGVVGHVERLGAKGLPLMLAIVVSTVLAIVVAALVFVGVARLTGATEDSE